MIPRRRPARSREIPWGHADPHPRLAGPPPVRPTRRRARLSQPRPARRTARQRPGLAHDARRKSPADAGPGARRPAPRHPRLRLVERSPARRGARRTGHRLPASHRPGRHLGHRPDAPHRRYRLHRSARQVQRGICATISTRATTASPSGRPTSTSSAIRAGAAARRPTARTRSSPPAWPSAFIQGMQGDDPHYLKVVATAKHYAVHSGPEPERHRFDAHPSVSAI